MVWGCENHVFIDVFFTSHIPTFVDCLSLPYFSSNAIVPNHYLLERWYHKK